MTEQKVTEEVRRPKIEVECEAARNIAKSMAQNLADLERFWPQSKRGSNAQRALNLIKSQREAIELCLNDALQASLPPWRQMTEEKPLFIPLKREWFEMFERGEKDTEYRAYNSRWCEATCRVGRRAVLSFGYSGRRMARVVVGFQKLPRDEAPEAARLIYPLHKFIAAIKLAPGGRG